MYFMYLSFHHHPELQLPQTYCTAGRGFSSTKREEPRLTSARPPRSRTRLRQGLPQRDTGTQGPRERRPGASVPLRVCSLCPPTLR